MRPHLTDGSRNTLVIKFKLNFAWTANRDMAQELEAVSKTDP